MTRSGHSQVVMVTRFPVEGRVKTRLHPALGAHGAARLHRQMSAHVALEVCALAVTGEAKVEVWHDGGTRSQMCRWLGPLPNYRPQPSGSLGQTLAAAMRTAFLQGAARCVIVGSDCPGMRASHLRQALAALGQADLVLGPADDGGYWLVGLHAPAASSAVPALFDGIAWGGAEVLRQTQRRASQLGLALTLLERLADVDRPEDLAHWQRLREVAPHAMTCSVVIPALDEAEQIEDAVRSAFMAGAAEVVVADGGSRDATRSLAAQAGAVVIRSQRGRAQQLNAGAQQASGELLLFLHADTRLQREGVAVARRALEHAGVVAGAYTYQAATDGLLGHLLNLGGTWRPRVTGHPYGDQGLFVRRRVFEALGGYPDLPVMEDWELVKRLRRLGRLVIVPEVAPSSAASFVQHGLLLSTAINVAVIVAYQLGVDPWRLATWRRRIARRGG